MKMDRVGINWYQLVNLLENDMVLGQYTGSLGAGNRITFPKRFSDRLGKTYLITKGLDQNLIMVAGPSRHLLIEDIEIKPFAPADIRAMQAFVLGNTFEVTLDRLNRFVIPSVLTSYAAIRTEVIFVGIESFIQLWDREVWDDYQNKIAQEIAQKHENLPRKK